MLSKLRKLCQLDSSPVSEEEHKHSQWIMDDREEKEIYFHQEEDEDVDVNGKREVEADYYDSDEDDEMDMRWRPSC